MTDEDRPTSPYFQKRLSKLKVWEFCLTFMANGVKSFARLSTAYFVYRTSPYFTRANGKGQFQNLINFSCIGVAEKTTES